MGDKVYSPNIFMNERNLEGVPGYLVFFDNLRVDKYVTGFRTNISLSGGMGTANVEMIYVPEFYQPEQESLIVNSVVEQGFENMTTVRIFSKNMFNDKYVQIFEGNLRGANRTRTRNGYSISFAVTDYMTWFNRTIVPLQLPALATYQEKVDILRWRAQGIDTSKVETVGSNLDTSFKGKSLKEYVSMIVQKTLSNNALFSDPNTVAAWDNPSSRICLMGDINETLTKADVIDFVININATSLNSMYVAFNDIARNLMFEFFQDRDGVVRMKPPFWNEEVLRDHVIDPAMVVSVSEDSDYSNFYTRVTVAGSMEEWEQNSDNAIDIAGMLTPAVAFVGDMNNASKAYLTSSRDANAILAKTAVGAEGDHSINVTNATYKSPLKSGYKMTSPFGQWRETRFHLGVDLVATGRDQTVVASTSGVVYKTGYGKARGFFVVVNNDDGYSCCYQHLKTGSIMVKAKQRVAAGTALGIMGNTGQSSGAHLHFEVANTDWATYEASYNNKSLENSNTIDPMILLAGTYSTDLGGQTTSANVPSGTPGGSAPLGGTDIDRSLIPYATSVGGAKLLKPSDDERKYGVSVFDTTQSLIRGTTASAISDANDAYIALGKYAKYIYYYLNSSVALANVQTMSMPWIRPGFNVWLDPLLVDKIYYVNAVQHVGNAQTGVYTNLGLTFGRSRKKFQSLQYQFGSLKPGDTDNVFINKIDVPVSTFSPYRLTKAADFDALKKRCESKYAEGNPNLYILKALGDTWYQFLYNTSDSGVGPATGHGAVMDVADYVSLDGASSASGGSGKSMALPNIDTSVKTYEYGNISWGTGTGQKSINKNSAPDSYGFMRYTPTGDYLIALGTYYSPRCGIRFEITLSTGRKFTAITGDIKSDAHTDSKHMYHKKDKSVIEFIIHSDYKSTAHSVINRKSATDGFGGMIKSIVKLYDTGAKSSTTTVAPTSLTQVTKITYQKGDVVKVTGMAYSSSGGKSPSVQLKGKQGPITLVASEPNSPYPYHFENIGWVAKSSLTFISRTGPSSAETAASHSSPAAISSYSSIDEVQKWLDSRYAVAPPVIRDRIMRHRKLINAAEVYIQTHYITEV